MQSFIVLESSVLELVGGHFDPHHLGTIVSENTLSFEGLIGNLITSTETDYLENCGFLITTILELVRIAP